MNITRENNILIITGEPSGDVRGAELLKELRPLTEGISFWGIGGDLLSAEGLDLIEHIRNLSVIGVWEAIKKIGLIKAQYKKCIEEIQRRKPKAAILIDYPGFNLRIAKYLHEQGIPVIYYIIPQVWAWDEKRVELLKRYADKILVLFKFETDFLKDRGVESEFTGHPIIDSYGTPDGRKNEKLTIALLPGSRKMEITNMFPVMLEAAERLRCRYKGDVRFILAENSVIDSGLYNAALSGHKGLDLERVSDNTPEVLMNADFAFITSGTATLEAAASCTPFVLLYRTSAFTAFLFFTFLNMPHIGLVNIIAKKEIAPEFLQKNATAENLASKAIQILDDPARMETMRKELLEVRGSLGEKGAAKRAACAIASFIASL